MKATCKPKFNILQDALNAINEHRKTTLFQNALKKAAYAGSPFLKHFWGIRVNRLMMTMLQLISIFTTLAGANYYLRGIHWTAPILFALAVQFGLLYYASSFTDADGRKSSHLFILALLTVISIVFSYTGMAITTFPPEQEYKETYQHYCEISKTYKEQLIDSTVTDEDIKTELNNFLVKVNSMLTISENKIQSLDSAIKNNNNIVETDKNTSKTTTIDSVTGESITTTSTKSGDASNAANTDNTNKIAEKNSLELYQQQLKTVLATISVDKLISYVKGETQDNEKSTVATDITYIITYYNQLDQLTKSQLPIDVNYIGNLCNKYKNYDAVSAIKLEATDSASSTDEQTTNDVQNWKNFFGQMLSDDSSAAAAVETLNTLKSDVNNNYRQLENAALTLGVTPSVSTELKSAKDQMNNYGDPNIQVIMYLTNDSYRNKVLGIFVLAALVDGLTFLLGVVNRKKRLSLLDPATNKELIDNEEQLFSIIFVSLIGSQVPDSLSQLEGVEFKTACTTYILSIKNCIHQFLSHFSNSPWTGHLGYGLYAPYKELSQAEGAVSIISVLHQLGYLQFLSPKDFLLLKNKFDGNNSCTEDTATTPSNDDYVCILRYRVEMYLHHNTAEISTMFIENALQKEVTV